MMSPIKLLSGLALLAFAILVDAQPMSLAEVQAAGAKPLTAAEAKELVTGAKTYVTLVNGSSRNWTNGPDGTFVANRLMPNNPQAKRNSARGTWHIEDNGAYCLTFDWGSAETESSCRMVWKAGNSYYLFSKSATADTKSGAFTFSR